MTTRTLFVTWLVVAASMTVASGCSGASAGANVSTANVPAETGVPQDLIDLAPSTATGVLRADLRLVRASPYYPQLRAWLDMLTQQQTPAQSAQNLDRVLDHSDELVLVMFEDKCAVLMRGNYTGSDRADATQIATQAEGQLVELDARTWLISEPAEARKIQSTVAGVGRRGYEERAPFRVLAPDVGFAGGAVVFVWEVPQGVHSDLGLEEPGATIVRPLTAVAGRVDIADALGLNVQALTVDAAGATSTANAVRAIQSQLVSNPLFAMLGVGPIVQRVQVQAEGARVVLGANVPRAELEPILERFGALIQSTLADYASNNSAPPASSAAPSGGGPSYPQSGAPFQ